MIQTLRRPLFHRPAVRVPPPGAFVILGASILGACLAACGGETPTAQSDKMKEPPRAVRVVRAARGALPDVVAVSGTLAAQEQVVLGTKVAGRLSELAVDLGSRVTKGQVLARLAPVDFELRVAQAEAALAQAQSRLGIAPGTPSVPADPPAAAGAPSAASSCAPPQRCFSSTVDLDRLPVVRQAAAVRKDAQARRDRAQALFAQGLLPRADLDAAEASFQVADSQYQDARDEVTNRQGVLAQRQSELDLARQQLADSVLVAPFDGAVRERQGAPGQYVAVGQPILTVVRTHPLRLKLAVPERAAATVRAGQIVRVHVDGDARTYEGRVVRLSPAIEETNRTLQLEAEVPNQDGALRPGSFALAEIVTAAERPVVLAPKSAVVTFAGIDKVLVVENDAAVEKRVTIGRTVGEQVEVVNGLDAGERVIAEPGNLVGGQAVTVTGTN